MKILDLPQMPKCDNVDEVSSCILDFYKSLGWDGNAQLDVKKASMNRNDYIRIVDELKSVTEDKSEKTQIVYLWANYAPRVDDNIKEGRIALYKGFIEVAQ